MEREPSAWGYNWATLFLRDINTEDLALQVGESWIQDSKTWSWVQQDSNQLRTALARTSSTSTNAQLYVSNNNLVSWPRWGLTPRQTGQLTISQNVTCNFVVIYLIVDILGQGLRESHQPVRMRAKRQRALLECCQTKTGNGSICYSKK
jgi:hypothetical protein